MANAMTRPKLAIAILDKGSMEGKYGEMMEGKKMEGYEEALDHAAMGVSRAVKSGDVSSLKDALLDFVHMAQSYYGHGGKSKASEGM